MTELLGALPVLVEHMDRSPKVKLGTHEREYIVAVLRRLEDKPGFIYRLRFGMVAFPPRFNVEIDPVEVAKLNDKSAERMGGTNAS